MEGAALEGGLAAGEGAVEALAGGEALLSLLSALVNDGIVFDGILANPSTFMGTVERAAATPGAAASKPAKPAKATKSTKRRKGKKDEL